MYKESKIGIIVFIIIVIICVYLLNVVAPKKCEEKSGIVVRSNIGIYEKCIYKGSDK